MISKYGSKKCCVQEKWREVNHCSFACIANIVEIQTWFKNLQISFSSVSHGCHCLFAERRHTAFSGVCCVALITTTILRATTLWTLVFVTGYKVIASCLTRAGQKIGFWFKTIFKMKIVFFYFLLAPLLLLVGSHSS